MYSVVMATMLAAGSATPAWHHCHSYCSSCYGCSSCHSYPGYRLFGHFHGCHGCYSGCSCSCYSGYAGYSGYCSCSSCYCSSYCSTCCTCTVAYSSCACSAPACCTSGPRVIEVPEKKKTEPIKPPNPNPKKTTEVNSVKSRVTVTAPEDARVWVDNVECPVRSFDTPALNANLQYVYNFRMQMIRDGQTVVQTQRAVITPGQPVNVEFKDGGTATVSR